MSTKEYDEEFALVFHGNFSDHLPVLFSIHPHVDALEHDDTATAPQFHQIQWRERDRQDKAYYTELFSRDRVKRPKSDQDKTARAASGIAEDTRKAASAADDACRKRKKTRNDKERSREVCLDSRNESKTETATESIENRFEKERKTQICKRAHKPHRSPIKTDVCAESVLVVAMLTTQTHALHGGKYAQKL